jgi:DNA repair exonuclease SbcCD ATPase subunit
MIKSLNINNFQSHKETKLEFSPGVNIIVGSSDSGKTAILRSLGWLCWNRPSGDAFRSWWSNSTSVYLETDEGIISRLKDKTDRYKIFIKGKDDIVFKAFGTSIPDEIVSFLNLNELNFQRQLDSPFLISATSSEVARQFNKVANLDKIDIATSNINGWIRDISFTIGKPAEKEEPATGLIKKIEDQKNELLKFKDLDVLGSDISNLEKLDGNRTELQKRKYNISILCQKYKIIKENIFDKSKILKVEKSVADILIDINARKTFQFTSDKLKSLVNQVKIIQQEINHKKAISLLESQVLNLLQLHHKRKTQIKARNLLFKTLSSMGDITTRLANENARYDFLHAKFEKEFPDVCPLCNQPIKKL